MTRQPIEWAIFMQVIYSTRASLVAQMANHLPAMWETWVWSLGQEDPLEKEMATHSSTLPWKIPWTEEPGRLNPWDCKEPDTAEQLHWFTGCMVLQTISESKYIQRIHITQYQKKSTTQLNGEQSIWIDIFPREAYRWPIDAYNMPVILQVFNKYYQLLNKWTYKLCNSKGHSTRQQKQVGYTWIWLL